MLDTNKFIKKLIKTGFTHLCVVPCSFATNLINACINNSDEIKYLPCASEAVACSTAAGLKLSGKSGILLGCTLNPRKCIGVNVNVIPDVIIKPATVDPLEFPGDSM